MAETTQTDDLMSRLPEDPGAGAPDWLATLKRTAAERLREGGFPTRKTEAWRFTSVKPVVSVPFEHAETEPADAVGWAEEHLGDDGTRRVYVVNGRPRLEGLSLPKGVTAQGLADLLASEPASVEPHLGRVADAEYFGALNQALFDDGLVLRIADGAAVEEPIQVVHVAQPGGVPTAAYPRVLVIAGEASQARVVETYLARGGERHLTNVVTEVVVGQAANLDHTRVVEGADNAFHVATLAVRQERDSTYASRVVTLGGALSRVDLNVSLAGQGANCLLDGVYHADGTEHVDHQTFVAHRAVRCASNEVYRGILDGKGGAVFNGIIKVERDAQKASAHQENRNLLLSDDATVHTKPHLEIDADDISASHGATIGAIDDASLFYLRSRGIGEDLARDILTFAFVHELLDRIPHGPVARRLGEALLARMPNGEAIRELLG